MKYLELPTAPVHLPAHGALPETVHVFDEDSVDAVNAALAAQRPLLVRGEPGTGKSQLARAAAVGLRRAFVSTVIDVRTEARDLHWAYDAVTRLAEAQVQGALGRTDENEVRKALAEERFLAPGPLWWTFDWASAERQVAVVDAGVPPRPPDWTPDHGVVLLIDEIDKADGAVPNSLLECLGSGQFTCPGGEVVTCSETRPLVVVTTNEERALPDAFLRRCLVLQLGWPEERGALVAALVDRGRAHFPNLEEDLLNEAAVTLAEDRETVLAKGLFPPGGAEYLDLLRALDALPGDRWETLRRIRRFALDKHPPEPRW